MHSQTKRNALLHALYALDGDESKLAAALGISVDDVLNYLHGQHELPIPVLLKAVRIVLSKTKVDSATQREVFRKINEANKRRT
jgi:hypothetical protein